MITHNEVIILIETIAIFFQGFSFRKRHMLIMLASSLIILLMSGLGMFLNGIGVYIDILSNINEYEAIMGFAYFFFWWIFGYILGGFQRITVAESVKVVKVK